MTSTSKTHTDGHITADTVEAQTLSAPEAGWVLVGATEAASAQLRALSISESVSETL